MRALSFIVLVLLPATGIAQQGSAPSRWVSARPHKVAWLSAGASQVLDDDSVQLDVASDWQELTLHFEFRDPTKVREIRLEILPSKSPAVRLGKLPRKPSVLFDVKPRIEGSSRRSSLLEFASCEYLESPSDDSTANCIDFLSDTGWTVPAFTESIMSHTLVLRFAEPVLLGGGDNFALTIDSGGSPELAVLSRLRVSFPAPKREHAK